jgi:hypothetical protein
MLGCGDADPCHDCVLRKAIVAPNSQEALPAASEVERVRFARPGEGSMTDRARRCP